MQYLRTPLTVPRYVLTVKYALFIALGLAMVPTARAIQLLKRTGMKKNG